jgi:hypothetical protein
MISRDVEIVDIDPRLWLNISSLWKTGAVPGRPPKNANVISILHEAGTVLHTYVPESYTVAPVQRIEDPRTLAEKLFHQYPGLDGVQILEKTSLRDFSVNVQKSDWQKMSYDEFHVNAYALAGQDPAGLCFYPHRTPAWNGFPLLSIQSWMETLPSPSAVMLGICRNAAPWFSLILKLVDKKIQLITTMEHLSRFNPNAGNLPSRPEDLQTISQLVTEHIAPLSAAVICEYSVMKDLLTSDQKLGVLRQAISENKAASVGLSLNTA